MANDVKKIAQLNGELTAKASLAESYLLPNLSKGWKKLLAMPAPAILQVQVRRLCSCVHPRTSPHPL